MNRIVKLVLNGPSSTAKRGLLFAAIAVIVFMVIKMAVDIAELVQNLKELCALGIFTTP